VSREITNPKPAPTKAANTAVPGTDHPRLSKLLHPMDIPIIHHKSLISKIMASPALRHRLALHQGPRVIRNLLILNS
jgi:hypothetical protein